MVSRRFLITILSTAMAVLLIAGAMPVLANSATIRLDYNPSVLKVTAIAAGNLKGVTASVDNISGSLRMVTAYGNLPGRTGTLMFADITLEALEAPGTTLPLNIAVVDMYNSAVQPVIPDAVHKSTLLSVISSGVLPVARPLQESLA
jgi:hypothetical protein